MLRSTMPQHEDLRPSAMIRDALIELTEIPGAMVKEARSSYSRMRREGTRRRVAIPIAMMRGTIGGIMDRHPNY